jgi:UDP:flavonoid glycosyltransferase YjiC (YdhE family)
MPLLRRCIHFNSQGDQYPHCIQYIYARLSSNFTSEQQTMTTRFIHNTTISIVLIVTVAVIVTQVYSKRILMSCIPFHAHHEIMFHIAKELKNRNHTIVFASFPDFRQRIESIGLEYMEISDLATSERSRIDIPDFNPAKTIGTMMDKVADMYESTYTTSLDILSNGDFDYVMMDMFQVSTLDAARQLNKKYSIVFGAGFLHFAEYEAVNYVPKSLLPGPLNSMHSIFSRLYDNYLLPAKILYYALPGAMKVNSIRKKYGIEQYMGLTYYWKNKLVIATSFFGMEYARPMLPSTVQVGPVISNEDMVAQISDNDVSLKQWLDIDQPVLYIAFGSLAAVKEWHIKTLFAGASTIKGVRVLVGLREQIQKQLNFNTSMVPHQYRIESWVNQKMVLAHKNVKVFLSHGGYMSISEAMFSHTPMLVLPFFGDQPGNAVRLFESGAGLTLDPESFTADEVSQKLQQLLNDKKYVQNMKRLHRIAMYNGGAKKAADAIELDMDVGVEHLATITDQFSWIEINDYDIKGVLLIIVSSIVWTIFNIVICRRKTIPNSKLNQVSQG